MLAFFDRDRAPVASIAAVKRALDTGCARYKCEVVSWEDATRGTAPNGALLAVGPNITDVRLKKQDGEALYVLRSSNWNERLGRISTDDVQVVTGNNIRGQRSLESVSLASVLRDTKKHGAYVGMTTPSLHCAALDGAATIRFQTVFLPVASATDAVQFMSEARNYAALDDNPKNLLMLCTSQGVSIEQDGEGYQPVAYHHINEATSKVHRYWLRSEASLQHGVGGAQTETREEAQRAAAAGLSNAMRIGTASMGTRLNAHMMVQVPLIQMHTFASMRMYNQCYNPYAGLTFGGGGAKPKSFGFGGGGGTSAGFEFESRCVESFGAPTVGESYAGRVSRGDELHDDWQGRLVRPECTRDEHQHVTITVTLFYMVVNGVPSGADVATCVAELDALYESCPRSGHLADSTMSDVTQPYIVPPFSAPQ